MTELSNITSDIFDKDGPQQPIAVDYDQRALEMAVKGVGVATATGACIGAAAGAGAGIVAGIIAPVIE